MVKAKSKTYTNHNGKEIKVPKGKNIRFSDDSHKSLVAYCKLNGYNLGAFCEIAALSKMNAERDNSIRIT